MKLAKEIADEHYDRDKIMPSLSALYDVSREELEATITAKLKPVREALKAVSDMLSEEES